MSLGQPPSKFQLGAAAARNPQFLEVGPVGIADLLGGRFLAGFKEHLVDFLDLDLRGAAGLVNLGIERRVSTG